MTRAISSNAFQYFRKFRSRCDEGETSQLVTFRLHVRMSPKRYAFRMENEPNIPPIIERYFDEASELEKQIAADELRTLFAALYRAYKAGERFDSGPESVVESDSLNH